MAVRFVSSVGGSNSNGGTSTSDALATIAYALGTAGAGLQNAAGANGISSGDIIYVNKTHTEVSGANWTLFDFANTTNWTHNGAPLRIISTDFTVGDGTAFTPMTTGSVGGSSGAATSIIASAGDGVGEPLFFVEFHGINLVSGTAYWTIKDRGRWDFIKCNVTAGSTRCFLADDAIDIIVHFDECAFNFGSQAIQTVIGTSATNGCGYECYVKKCTFSGITGTPTDSMFVFGGTEASNRLARIVIEDCNLTSFNALTDTIAGTNPCGWIDVTVRRCKLSGAFDDNLLANGSSDIYARHMAFFNFYECSSSDYTATPLPLSYHKNCYGATVESSSSVYYTSNPATDGENNYSIKVTTSATLTDRFTVPGYSFPMSVWHTGGNKTLTVRFADDDTGNATLKDDEVWLEIHSPGHTADTGSATIGRYISTRATLNNGVDAGTSTYLKTDTDSSWTSGGGTLSATEYKFEVPVNTTEPGAVNVTIHFSKPGPDTYYVSPLLELS